MSNLNFRKPVLSALVATSALLGACGGPDQNIVDPQADTADSATQSSALDVIILPDYCLTSAPDATLTMGPNVLAVSSTSPNAGYSTKSDGCPRWVVDINVPYNSSYPGTSTGISSDTGAVGLAGGTIEYSGGYSIPTSAYGQAYCESYREYVKVYKKAAGSSSFVQVDSWTTQGIWNSTYAYCSLSASPHFFGMTPPSSGTDVYRFAISVKLDGAFRQVGVQADHPFIIK